MLHPYYVSADAQKSVVLLECRWYNCINVKSQNILTGSVTGEKNETYSKNRTRK